MRRTLLHTYLFKESKIPVAFFDADGTLRSMHALGIPAHKREHVEILPFVADKIRKLNEQNYFIVIVSNQGDVGRLFSADDAESALAYTVELLAEQEATVHYMDFAEFRDDHRKPKTGMANRLETFIKTNHGVEIDYQNSFMVGDGAWMKEKDGVPAEVRPDGRPGYNHSNADRLFAHNLGIRFIEASDFFDWRAIGFDHFETPELVTSFKTKFPDYYSNCQKKLKK